MTSTSARCIDGEVSTPELEIGLSSAQEFALLCRVLHREGFGNGYVDTLSGHVTYRQPDGTILTSPFGIPWSEITASDVVVADHSGRQIGGRWRINPGAVLHFALHRERSVVVTVHNHPTWATIWANSGRIPPIYDQTGAKVRGKITVVDEYAGHVANQDVSNRVIAAMHDADIALLAHHGVLVVGNDIPDALMQSLAIEARSKSAWHVEMLTSSATQLDDGVAEAMVQQLARVGYAKLTFAALVRRELRADDSVLD